jgi:hypothetical protein
VSRSGQVPGSYGRMTRERLGISSLGLTGAGTRSQGVEGLPSRRESRLRHHVSQCWQWRVRVRIPSQPRMGPGPPAPGRAASGAAGARVGHAQWAANGGRLSHGSRAEQCGRGSVVTARRGSTASISAGSDTTLEEGVRPDDVRARATQSPPPARRHESWFGSQPSRRPAESVSHGQSGPGPHAGVPVCHGPVGRVSRRSRHRSLGKGPCSGARQQDAAALLGLSDRCLSEPVLS